MNDPIKLKPCPFCEGPPVPIVQTYGGGAASVKKEYGDRGLMVRAFVFCHECGCDGPSKELVIYDDVDYRSVEAQAVNLWQQRDNRHRRLFDGGVADGLNLYPRKSKS